MSVCSRLGLTKIFRDVGVTTLVFLTLAGVFAVDASQQGPFSAQIQRAVASLAGWDDLVAPASAINPLGADGQMTVITDATGYIGCLQADAAGETAVIQFQLPHGIMDNTDVRPHIHWLVSGADVTGSATFQAKFRHCPLSGTCSSWSEFADGTITLEPADSEGATGLTSWTMADSSYNFGISDVILMQFKLTSLSVTATIVCSADIHYQRSVFGSKNEGSR